VRAGEELLGQLFHVRRRQDQRVSTATGRNRQVDQRREDV